MFIVQKKTFYHQNSFLYMFWFIKYLYVNDLMITNISCVCACSYNSLLTLCLKQVCRLRILSQKANTLFVWLVHSVLTVFYYTSCQNARFWLANTRVSIYSITLQGDAWSSVRFSNTTLSYDKYTITLHKDAWSSVRFIKYDSILWQILYYPSRRRLIKCALY